MYSEPFTVTSLGEKFSEFTRTIPLRSRAAPTGIIMVDCLPLLILKAQTVDSTAHLAVAHILNPHIHGK